MSSFPLELDYIWTPEFLKRVLHVISAISIPIHCFGLYVVLCRTPDKMKKVKWYLVSLYFWTVSFDYSVSLLIMPIILFPEFAGYPLGLFRLVDMSYYVYAVVGAMMFMGCLLVSIIAIFENQFQTMCLFTGNSKWEFWRRPWLIGHYITAVVASISFGLFQPEQSEARIRVLEKLPPLPAYIKESSIYVFTENGTYHLTVFLILIPFICIEVFIFVKELILTTSTLLASKRCRIELIISKESSSLL